MDKEKALKIWLPVIADGVKDLPECKEALEMAIKALEQTRWIPISERLPNFNDIVLASADSDYDELRVILTVYNAEEFWFNGKIKAWMPLPEPYKAESEE